MEFGILPAGVAGQEKRLHLFFHRRVRIQLRPQVHQLRLQHVDGRGIDDAGGLPQQKAIHARGPAAVHVHKIGIEQALVPQRAQGGNALAVFLGVKARHIAVRLRIPNPGVGERRVEIAEIEHGPGRLRGQRNHIRIGLANGAEKRLPILHGNGLLHARLRQILLIYQHAIAWQPLLFRVQAAGNAPNLAVVLQILGVRIGDILAQVGIIGHHIRQRAQGIGLNEIQKIPLRVIEHNIGKFIGSGAQAIGVRGVGIVDLQGHKRNGKLFFQKFAQRILVGAGKGIGIRPGDGDHQGRWLRFCAQRRCA